MQTPCPISKKKRAFLLQIPNTKFCLEKYIPFVRNMHTRKYCEEKIHSFLNIKRYSIYKRLVILSDLLFATSLLNSAARVGVQLGGIR